VGASNELPESDELDALYDRFLLRKEVLPVSDAGLMRLLLALPSTAPARPVDADTAAGSGGGGSGGGGGGGETGGECGLVFAGGLHAVSASVTTSADAVALGHDVCVLLRDLRTHMRQELGVEVSDRRLVKAASLLRVSAATNGRSRVDLLDCLLLQVLSPYSLY
jgi:MoxR-like ATPase